MEALRPTDPSTIGDIRLLGRLGGGGMGQVYLGETPGRRTVAVKVIRAEIAADPAFRGRFAREVAAARRVTAAWTAEVVAADADAEIPWLATEYIPGPSLREAVDAGGPVPPPAATLVALTLVQALAALHDAGLVHRDLKPGNVLLSPRGPVVIDFGLARPYGTESAHLTEVIGTPRYMAPEQIRGQPLGPASDVFSFGSTLTYALTGHGPFDGDGPHDALQRVLRGRPDLAGVPTRWRDLILACLAKRPERRPSTRQIIDVLTAAAAGVRPPYGGWLPPPPEEEVTAPLQALTPTTQLDPRSDAATSPAPEAPPDSEDAEELARTLVDPTPPTLPDRVPQAGQRPPVRSREGAALAATIHIPLILLAAIPAMLFPLGIVLIVYLVFAASAVEEVRRASLPRRGPDEHVGPATVLFDAVRGVAMIAMAIFALLAATLVAMLLVLILVLLTTGVLGPLTSLLLGGALELPRTWFNAFVVKLGAGLAVAVFLLNLPRDGKGRPEADPEPGPVSWLRRHGSELSLLTLWAVGVIGFAASLLFLPSLVWWPLPFGR